jgi:hypothetical protein
MTSPNYHPSAVLRASISANTSGDNTLVAAVTGKRIRVVGLFMTVGTAGTARFESGTADGFLSGAMALAVGTPLVLPQNLDGWFETAEGALLNMILSGTLGAGGVILYQTLP